jgi:3-dehydroquinate synthase
LRLPSNYLSLLGHRGSEKIRVWKDTALRRLQVRTRARPHEYEIRIGTGVLSEVGQITRRCLGDQSRQIVTVSNKKVFALYGAALSKSLKTSGFTVQPWLIGDGERYKSIGTVEELLVFLKKIGLERGDAVVSLGGGVVGDVTGFAAAVYLRGVQFIQVPTTLLAQVDSSVGGKTGVNFSGGKNMVGSFYQPTAVVADIETLRTLPPRELTAGWCECVKQGAISSPRLFNETANFLRANDARRLSVSSQLEQLIAAHCAFKSSIVRADEREDSKRSDNRSRRILNFGHTIAHALESVTHYRRFRHGEAVGLGMLVAGELSKNLGLLEQTELELLKAAVELCGPLPAAKDLDEGELIKATGQDKKVSSGRVQWVLLERIGGPRIIDGKEISPTLLRKSLRAVFQRRLES